MFLSLLLNFFISSKYDFYVDAERMIVVNARNVKKYDASMV